MMRINSETELRALIGKTISFTRKINEFECYADPNVRAKVYKIRYDIHKVDDPQNDDDVVHAIGFDYTEFDEFNKTHEQANYWGKNGVANLTAREAGQYFLTEEIFVNNELPFEIVES